MNPKIRPKSLSRTNIFEFASLKSLRFEMITAAGRILNVSGSKIHRLSQSTMCRKLFEKVQVGIERFETRQKQAA